MFQSCAMPRRRAGFQLAGEPCVATEMWYPRQSRQHTSLRTEEWLQDVIELLRVCLDAASAFRRVQDPQRAVGFVATFLRSVGQEYLDHRQVATLLPAAEAFSAERDAHPMYLCLRNSQQLLRSPLELVPGGTWYVDPSDLVSPPGGYAILEKINSLSQALQPQNRASLVAQHHYIHSARKW